MQTYMKRFLFILLLVLGYLSAGAQIDLDAPAVDYMAYQKPLVDVLQDIARLTKTNFAFSKDDIPPKKVNINVRKASLRESLEYILSGTGLVFEDLEGTVVIYRWEIYDKARFTVSGYVYDAQSGERILFADVYLSNFKQGVSANEHGFYSINLKRGEVHLVCSYLGYGKFEKTFRLNRDIRLDIPLEKSDQVVLDQVVIRDLPVTDKHIDFYKPEQLMIDEMERSISLGGEDDILRYLFTNSGVLTGADGFGGMYVRGGSQDQNQILLDGVPIYNPTHALGLFSVFNSQAIKSARLYKSEFPSRYGGCTSSILDVRTKDGDKQRHHGDLNVGLFTVKAGLEGPLIKNKASYFIHARRTYADLWIGSVRNLLNDREGSSGKTDYYNFDFNVKVNIDVNKNNSLFLTAFQSGDHLTNDYRYTQTIEPKSREEFQDQLMDWHNRLFVLKWNNVLNDKVFFNTSAFVSNYSMDNFNLNWVAEKQQDKLQSYSFNSQLYQTQIIDYGLESHAEFKLSENSRLNSGLRFVKHQYVPFVKVLDNENLTEIASVDEIPDYSELLENSAKAMLDFFENRVYLESETDIRNHTQVMFGLHGVHYLMNGQNRLLLEPRMFIKSNLGNGLFAQSSLTRMTQFNHLINSNGLGFPSQVWLPATDQVQPQSSWQFNAGFEYLRGKFIVGSQAYYKDLDHLQMIAPGAKFEIDANTDWESKLIYGKGYSYGLENYLHVQKGSFTGNLNYTLSWAKRQFDDLNGGELFDDRFSRRHSLNAGITHKLTAQVDYSIHWTFGSGNLYTFPTQIASFVENGVVNTIFVYEKLNNASLPAYHRLDIEFNFTNPYEWGKQKLSLGLYNVYNRKNPFYVTYDYKKGNLDVLNTAQFKYVYIFPVMPVLSYSISF